MSPETISDLPGTDLGKGHSFVWLTAKTDQYIVPNEFRDWHGDDETPDGESVDLVGIIERHQKACDMNMPHLMAIAGPAICPPNCPGSEPCGGAVYFCDIPDRPGSPVWGVHKLRPLTISPSVLCRTCGSHGFIKEGEWVNV